MRHILGDEKFRASRRRRGRAGLTLGLLAASTAWTGVAHAQYTARVSLVSSADSSRTDPHPFNAAAYARVPLVLSTVGYTEKEYFLSGAADAYKYTDAPSSDAVTTEQAAPIVYTNRILVRLPTNPANFHGNVIVEIANDALVSDNETAWPFANSQFINDGDAYILLTSEPQGLATLKAFDAIRYRALSWPTVAATKSCSASSSAEAGIIYDQITELGNLLKSNGAGSPLAGYDVKHLFLTGYSGGASILLTYNRVFGQTSGLYDGYFVAAGGFRAPLNGCESSTTTDSFREPPGSSVSAVFQTQTESELYLASAESTTIPKSADSNTATSRYRYYEIAGTSHVNGDLLAHSPERADFPTVTGVTYLADVTQSQLTSECDEPSGSVISAFPNRYVYDALWANLEHWVASGTAYSPPSESGPIDTSVLLYLGAGGTPTGGVRSPAVDVAIDNYAYGTVVSGSAALQTFCALTGDQTAMSAPSNSTTVAADASKLYGQGFLTSYDLTTLTATPALAYTYPNGSTTIPDGSP